MDLLLIFLAGVLLVIVLLMLLARMHPGSGADLLDWDPLRASQRRAVTESDDMERALERHNELRRERGLDDLTEEELRLEIADEQRRLRRDHRGLE